MDETTNSIDYWQVIKWIDHELKRINWSVEKAKNHIQFYYGVKSRMHLKDQELLDFLDYLKSIPTPVSKFRLAIKSPQLKRYSDNL